MKKIFILLVLAGSLSANQQYQEKHEMPLKIEDSDKIEFYRIRDKKTIERLNQKTIELSQLKDGVTGT